MEGIGHAFMATVGKFVISVYILAFLLKIAVFLTSPKQSSRERSQFSQNSQIEYFRGNEIIIIFVICVLNGSEI